MKAGLIYWKKNNLQTPLFRCVGRPGSPQLNEGIGHHAFFSDQQIIPAAGEGLG